MRDVKDTIFGRRVFFWFIALWLAGAFLCKCFAFPIEYNPEGSPIPTARLVEAIEYAAGQYNARLDAGAEYAGTTGEREANGKIIIQWASFATTGEPHALQEVQASGGMTLHTADLDVGRSVVLGYARWWTWNSDGSLVRAQVVLNSDEAPRHVDKCVMELLVHELGHVLFSAGHSPWPDDVMFESRGYCRYSLSLADIELFKRPLASCHAELTPHGSLEYLDHLGRRIVLVPATPGSWVMGHSLSYSNPFPHYCDGAMLIDGEVWVEVWSYWPALKAVFRLKQNSAGVFLLLQDFPLR